VDDQIQFQGVKFDFLKLGVSMPTKQFSFGGKLPDHVQERRNNFRVRQPSILVREANCEVNGSMDPYQCFTVKLYYRQARKGVLLGGHYFRLYHPEANAYVQASSNPDKGEILDSLGTKEDPLRVCREGGVPAHIAYMKPFVSSFLASDRTHTCAKAVWCFESVDPTHCHEIRWDTPLRLRHVPSGKYLSVITSKPATLREPRDPAAVYYDAALVFLDGSLKTDDGSIGSPSSLLFYVAPTDVTSDTLKVVASTVFSIHHCFHFVLFFLGFSVNNSVRTSNIRWSTLALHSYKRSKA
jgi:hypothetical protein